MHDPFQNYATLAGYTTGINPLALAGQQNYSPYGTGLNPLAIHQQIQQMQLASLLGGQNALQNPYWGLQNPLIAGQLGGLQNPQIHPLALQLLHQQGAFGQVGIGGVPLGQTGFGQTGYGSPFGQSGYPLAPQSWIGQGGYGGAQVHPLYQQLALRALTTPGIQAGTVPGIGF